MGTSAHTRHRVERRFPEGEATDEAQLREEVSALQEEISALRAELAEHGELSNRIDTLREANENLVLASISAANRQDEAELANRRQNEFLAMLAHELRNPLAPISMASTLLARIPDASPQLVNLRNIIGRQVEQMAHLLDDLLDAARISSGKITLTLEPVLLAEVLEQAVETVAPRIAERGQKLTADIPDGPVVINGDRVRLTQVFTNLLSNASKYTHDTGAINLAAVPGRDSVRVTLSDNGIGMAPDVLPHIFELFTQGPRTLARSEGGLGVGLNVVRNIVNLHGGEVSVASLGPGQGSVFTVELPVASAVEPVHHPLQVGADDPSCRVLLVEDNVDACRTLAAFLSAHGHVVSSAYNGMDGLENALHGQFDVIVCDIGLPGLDGYALMNELRATLGDARPHAIALTGYCQPEDRQRAHEAGFDEFMVKPVDAAALLASIAKVGPRERAGGQAASPG